MMKDAKGPTADPDSTFRIGSRCVPEIAGVQFEGILHRSAEPCTVRRLAPEELPEALSLIWEVFCQFEAPEYSEEGVQEFRASLDDDERNRAMHFYGAYAENELVGVLAMRKPQHIGYFFVKATYHRRGIGKKLFETMRRDYAQQTFTVNSSPFAVEIYRHIGFQETDTEQVVKGLRYTAMKFKG